MTHLCVTRPQWVKPTCFEWIYTWYSRVKGNVSSGSVNRAQTRFTSVADLPWKKSDIYLHFSPIVTDALPKFIIKNKRPVWHVQIMTGDDRALSGVRAFDYVTKCGSMRRTWNLEMGKTMKVYLQFLVSRHSVDHVRIPSIHWTGT